MAQKEDGYNISDTGNWNVASDFSRIKIMKPLDNCDHYENIAKFGHDSFMEQIYNHTIPTENLKIAGFDRLVNELLKLISNSKFAMKRGKTGEESITCEKKLRTLLRYIQTTYRNVKSPRNKTVTLVIDYDKYNRALNEALELKSKINELLNKNHLIFTDKDEFDPQAYKEQIKAGAITKG